MVLAVGEYVVAEALSVPVWLKNSVIPGVEAEINGDVMSDFIYTKTHLKTMCKPACGGVVVWTYRAKKPLMHVGRVGTARKQVIALP